MAHSEETKKKMSLSKMGDRNPMKRLEVRLKVIKAKTGIKYSDITRKKMSISQSGEKHSQFGTHRSEETKRRISESQKGKIAWNKGLKGFLSGESSPHWVKDRNNLKRYNDNVKDRRSSAYADWRKQVWKRDNFICRISNSECCGKIEAHHILGWVDYPDLRYEPNNGITLCHAHHPKKRAEEKRLIPTFQELVSVSKKQIAI